MVAKIYGTAIVFGLLAAIPAARAGDYETQRGITDGSPYAVMKQENTTVAGVAGPSGPAGRDAANCASANSEAKHAGGYERQRGITDGSPYGS